MSAHQIVERLEHCRESGSGSWLARCPAHDDSSPSLSIKDAGGGRTLIHCHAGCGALEVLDALGLDWSALYPEEDNYRPNREKYARAVDELVVDIALTDIEKGKTLSRGDRDRAAEALRRLECGEPSPVHNDFERGVQAVSEREAARNAILGRGEI